MATPHMARIALLIKQKHPRWGPAAFTSAMMTTAPTSDHSGSPILAQSANQLAPATPFDFGAGLLIFNVHFQDYVQFLCSVPDVGDRPVIRATGTGCSTRRRKWCSDLNTASVTVSNLVGSRRVIRLVTNVSGTNEVYRVTVKEPLGVNVAVWPQAFKIRGNASSHLRIKLKAIKATRSYTFGEMALHGSRKLVVRVPIAVCVSTVF